MSLDCKDKLIKFYESLGYVLIPGNSNSMTIRYDEGPTLKRNATSSGSSGTVGDSCQTVSLDFASWQLAANAAPKSKLWVRLPLISRLKSARGAMQNIIYLDENLN